MIHYDLDTMAIEKRARALRASFVRDGIANLFARLRRTRSTGNAHA